MDVKDQLGFSGCGKVRGDGHSKQRKQPRQMLRSGKAERKPSGWSSRVQEGERVDWTFLGPDPAAC